MSCLKLLKKECFPNILATEENFESEIFLKYDAEIKQRLDKYITSNTQLSRSYVQKLIESSNILVNKKPSFAAYNLKFGDLISLKQPEPLNCDIKGENILLDIIYEDKDVLIINKQRNLIVHPSSNNCKGTLVNALIYYLGENLSSINGRLRPGIVHRIDKDTTGLLIVVKNDLAHIGIQEQIRNHSINRQYKAILNGTLSDGILEFPIGRSIKDRKKMSVRVNGKNSITFVKTLEKFDKYSFVEFTLKTGRTHQIRVVASHLNHSIVGDKTYSKIQNKWNLTGQLLHAYKINFVHPITNKEIILEAPFPEDFVYVLEDLRKTMFKVEIKILKNFNSS